MPAGTAQFPYPPSSSACHCSAHSLNLRSPSTNNAREGKRTLAQKHGHLRVLLLSASESERGFGSVFHHHFSKPTALGWLCLLWRFPAPRGLLAHSACANPVAMGGHFAPNPASSIPFCSLFLKNSGEPPGVGTRRLPLPPSTCACVEAIGFSH